MNIQEEKAIVRKQMKEILAKFRQTDSTQEELQACKLLTDSLYYKNSNFILTYAALPGEFSLDKFIQQALKSEKTVYLPKSFPQDCSMEFYALKNHLPYSQQLMYGSYGIREPLSNREKYEDSAETLILIPGIAFTRTGQRLGRGKGFYDRFLSRLSTQNCTLMGVCYQWQILGQLPTEETDIPIDCILTPEELINCTK